MRCGLALRKAGFIAEPVDVQSVKTSQQCESSDNLLRPLPGEAHLLRWDVLDVGQRFAVAIGGYRRKCLVVVLRPAIKAQCKQPSCRAVPIRAERKLADGCIVHLEWSAVVTVFAIERTAEKHTAAITEDALQA